LAERAGYSPVVQAMAALLTSKMPVEDVSTVLEQLTGVEFPCATLDREARRQRERSGHRQRGGVDPHHLPGNDRRWQGGDPPVMNMMGRHKTLREAQTIGPTVSRRE